MIATGLLWTWLRLMKAASHLGQLLIGLRLGLLFLMFGRLVVWLEVLVWAPAVMKIWWLGV